MLSGGGDKGSADKQCQLFMNGIAMYEKPRRPWMAGAMVARSSDEIYRRIPYGFLPFMYIPAVH